ncbi:murein hydrolase activator EnvC family protein [Actinomadura terrae]|uniref:murein hydrolase activator EnvC family protein n=1 Tax=Actinomadura terrae TaxID=604353 RepID=UPI0027DF6AB2|nr:M23 family metallopeptidase [Actinomadura terrae]
MTLLTLLLTCAIVAGSPLSGPFEPSRMDRVRTAAPSETSTNLNAPPQKPNAVNAAAGRLAPTTRTPALPLAPPLAQLSHAPAPSNLPSPTRAASLLALVPPASKLSALTRLAPASSAPAPPVTAPPALESPAPESPALGASAPMQLAPGPGASTWRWPLGPPAPRVLRSFSPPPAPWAAGHRGVDLAASPGQQVHAAGAGRVSYAGRLAGQGVVAITHGPLRTTYLPVRPEVQVGHQVPLGAPIGVLEKGPFHCPVACLHWGLLRGHLYLDPLSLVIRRVRLLPYWSPPVKASTASPQPEPSRAPPQEPRLGLRDATTATGGALTGIVLTFSVAFAWRRTRPRPAHRRPHRPPPGVIDLARERRLRRTP